MHGAAYLPQNRVIFSGRAAALGRRKERVSDRMACEGLPYERLWRPLLLAALNTEPHEASAVLAGAVLRESIAKGGRACRPLVAWPGLSEAFIDPAVRFLTKQGSSIHYGERLKSLRFENHMVAQLNFGDALSDVSNGDGVILAVPPLVASALCPILRRLGTARHCECTFPHRASGRASRHHRCGQRHGRMGVLLSATHFRHDQRRRPAARYRAGDACRKFMGGGGGR